MGEAERRESRKFAARAAVLAEFQKFAHEAWVEARAAGVKRIRPVKWSTLRVMKFLCEQADEHGRAVVSFAAIAAGAFCSERVAFSAVREAEGYGFLEMRGPDRYQGPNCYQLRLPEGSAGRDRGEGAAGEARAH